MPWRALILTLSSGLLLSGIASAQLLPGVGDTVGRTTGEVGRIGDRLGDGLSATIGIAGGLVDRLARTRLDRLGDLVRRNPQALDHDLRGDPAVKGELLLIDASPAVLQAATAAGFTLIDQGQTDALGIATTRLAIPAGTSLAKAEKALAKAAPDATIQSNPIYQQSGQSEIMVVPARKSPTATLTTARIGMIDGGVAPHAALPGNIIQRGFARGAPLAGDHGTAVASILVGQGAVQGVAPLSQLLVADIYGADPKGGSALAIAQATGWLVQSGARVINISLTGPPNPLLARVVAAADRQGVILVAPVGNDGPAAPPAYPASYPQVIAVTGVDGRGRPLVEAGKALHVDFAAPGADLKAANARGGVSKMRGTSFAAPFVAGRIAHFPKADRRAASARLAGEATPRKGKAVPRLICGNCATR